MHPLDDQEQALDNCYRAEASVKHLRDEAETLNKELDEMSKENLWYQDALQHSQGDVQRLQTEVVAANQDASDAEQLRRQIDMLDEVIRRKNHEYYVLENKHKASPDSGIKSRKPRLGSTNRATLADEMVNVEHMDDSETLLKKSVIWSIEENGSASDEYGIRKVHNLHLL